MHGPSFDSFYEDQPLRVCLEPSLPATPAVVPAVSNEKIEPAVPHDVAVIFNPLGFIPIGSRVTQVPAMTPTTGATPETACDPSPQPGRRAGMLTISTPTNPSSSLANRLASPLGTRHKDDAGPRTNTRIKPTRQFSTTSVFRLHRCPIHIALCLLLRPPRSRALMFLVHRMTLVSSSPLHRLSIPSHQSTQNQPLSHLIFMFSRGFQGLRTPA